MLEKNQIVDIIEVTYSRIMQLKFNREFISTMVSNPIIGHNYPNLTWSLRSSFATDAYTTISSLLSTGNYSFGRLGQEYPNIQEQIQITEKEITSKIDDFRNIRNQMFCHAVRKKSTDAINNIYIQFESIFYTITKLHSFCCGELGIKDNDYKHYDTKAFKTLDDEIHEFCDILLSGYLNVATDNFLKHNKRDPISEIK